MNVMIEGVTDCQIRTRMVQGPGAVGMVGRLVRELGCVRAMVVTDPGIVAAGHVARAVESLSREKIETAVFDHAHENPTTEHVDRAVEFAREFRPDMLVGLGGGSSMDTAKGCNFLLAGGGRMQDYWGTGKGRGNFLPMIAVPTTGGTGSEMQSYALISDAGTHVKMACGDVRAAFAIAILDPELTRTQPATVTAVTGIDAISHAVETWVSRRRNPLSMMFSREAFRLLASAFPRVIGDPDSLQARTDMQLGAALAGLAIENSMLGAAHALANPVTARFGTIHGQAVGITLPHVIRFNGVQFESWYRELLLAAGMFQPDAGSATDQLAGLVTGWVALGGLHTTLGELQVPENLLTAMSEEAASQWTANFNPRPVSKTESLQLYQAAL